MSRVALVTGGCGFVGRNLVRSLLADNDEIWIVDDLSTGRHPDEWLSPEDRGRVTFIEDTAVMVFGAAPDAQPDWPEFEEAYHLASIVGGRKNIEEQPLQVGIDLAIDSLFFSWVWRSGRVGRVLYASSSAAYPVELQGTDGAVALEEKYIDFASNQIAMPDMTYGWSKLTGEYLAFLLARQHGVPTCSIRPFSGYGEDQDLTYPVPAIAARAAAREDPLVVWGSGHQGRDFVHIEDCVDAMRLAIRAVEDGSGLNIGSGTLTSFLEVARLFADLAGYEPEVHGTQTGPVGVHARYADVTESEKRLDWQPRISISEGFGRVLAARERELATG